MVNVYHKSDSIKKIREIFSLEEVTSVLLIRGNDSYKISGAKDIIEPQISGYNKVELSGFSFYPTSKEVAEVIKVINDYKVNFILAVGGGAVMDVAKAASMLYDEPLPVEEYILGREQPRGRNIKLMIIPTTAGTGAEITPFAAVYMDGVKYSLEDSNMLPDYVILAPELTYTLGPRITAQGGVDALANVIEGFWSVNATEESKDYGRKAAPLILNNLSGAVNNPNSENREGMLIGSHLAAKSVAIAKTTAAHALSYPMTAHYGIPHGHAVALTLPYFFLINEQATEKNIQEGVDLNYVQSTFEELLGLLEVKSGEEGKNKLISLMGEIGLEKRLSDFGIQKADLHNIVENGFNPQRIKNNPVKISENVVWDILYNIL